MDWSTHYPAFVAGPRAPSSRPSQEIDASASISSSSSPPMTARVEIADIGCGFGGLLFALSPQVPANTLVLGLEIRASVTEFVVEKVKAMRAAASSSSSAPASSAPASSASASASAPVPTEGEAEAEASAPAPTGGEAAATTDPPGPYQNISALRANTMKHLPNLFPRASLRTIFLCFPDPHFKARKHKARIVSPALCAEYAYVLRPGVGRVYTVTDVRDLHEWMVKHLSEHPLFRRVGDAELGISGGEGGAKGGEDPWVTAITAETEESKKVTRNGGEKLVAVFERREDPEWVEEDV